MRTSSLLIMLLFVKKRKHDTMIRMERRKKQLKRSQPAEIFGWVGGFFVLAGYGLASTGIASSNTVIYNLLFLIGSAGLAVITYRHRAFQSFVVNSIFVVLALFALIRLVFLA